MASKPLKATQSSLSDASESHHKPPLPPTITFGRRTSSGRYVSYSRDDLDSELGNSDYMVQIPATPDNQPAPPGGNATVSERVEEQFVSNSIFTGGSHCLPRAHLMKRVIETQTSHPQMAGVKGSSCAVLGCDGRVMSDERGNDIVLCECDYKICRDCYVDAVKLGDGICPGCKELYKSTDLDEKVVNNGRTLPLLPSSGMSKNERRLSLMKSTKSALIRSQTGDFDHTRWLFETRGTYGYGNAIWPKQGSLGSELDDGAVEPLELMNKPWKPLTRKLNIRAAVLSPYRLIIFVRMVALGLFLAWRINHPNYDAVWLWGMSVVCELWFAFSWLLDQMPKLCPINRSTDLNVLKEKFETPFVNDSNGRSDLPGIDVFVSTADPEKEPPLVTANTILSILAADYPIEKLACYVSDDGGALLTFEAMAEAASFANLWVPFCRKHSIEPRNPESYFNLKRDPYKNKVRTDFVKDRRRVKHEYDEFKVRTNGLPDSIRRRSDAYHAREEIRAMKLQRQNKNGDEPVEVVKIRKATWMADGTHWPGTWLTSAPEHSRGDHSAIIQVMLKPPSDDPLKGNDDDAKVIDLNDVDIRLPLLVYVSREKRPGYDHNKKAGAMNALVRASAIMSNGPFILNLDCDHYIYNSQAMREGMCFMMDRGGDCICYVQFPQRFEGIDPSDRYANHNTVFFDVNMRALDGLQGPVYVGTGCLFRRMALYGFDPPRSKERHPGLFDCCFFGRRKKSSSSEENRALRLGDSDDDDVDLPLQPKKFGNSGILIDSIRVAEFQGRPLADHPSVKNGRPPGALTIPRDLLDATTVAEAINVVSCWYEDKTEWGQRIGWIYGSVTEDVVTGYRMHNRGWKSVYCITKRDAFRGTAPINLTDRLHQVLRWATGSVEIFFSRNNALLASRRMKLLQRIAYLNVGIYPFTSFFLIVYCFLPALSLFSGQFIVQTLNVTFLTYLLIITITLCMLAMLEIKWSGIELEEWWRNEQFWLIGGTSAHLAAVLQGLLKVVAGIEISFTLTSKSGGDDVDDEFADLYIVKWTSLMLPPITIMMVNLIAIAVGFSRTIYSTIPQWSRLIGGVFFSFWVLAHLYPFAKGLMGRRGRTPTIVFVWSGLIAITISLLWVAINPPSGDMMRLVVEAAQMHVQANKLKESSIFHNIRSPSTTAKPNQSTKNREYSATCSLSKISSLMTTHTTTTLLPILLLLFPLIAPLTSRAAAPPSRNKDLLVAIQEMQRATYFAFAMLINLSPPNLFQGNLTFLMPKDRALSRTIMLENAVSDFVLRHSIPSPLLFDDLQHLPTGSVLPSSEPNFTLRVENNGRRSFFLNDVRIVSPNICVAASSTFRCHGMDGVLSMHNNDGGDSTTVPSPNCSNSTTRPKSPIVGVAPPSTSTHPSPLWWLPPSLSSPPPPQPPFALNNTTTPSTDSDARPDHKSSGTSHQLPKNVEGLLGVALVILSILVMSMSSTEHLYKF